MTGLETYVQSEGIIRPKPWSYSRGVSDGPVRVLIVNQPQPAHDFDAAVRAARAETIARAFVSELQNESGVRAIFSHIASDGELSVHTFLDGFDREIEGAVFEAEGRTLDRFNVPIDFSVRYLMGRAAEDMIGEGWKRLR